MIRKQTVTMTAFFCVDFSLSVSRNLVNTWSVFLAEALHTTTGLLNVFDIQIIRCNTDPVCVCVCVRRAALLLFWGHLYFLVFVNYTTFRFGKCSSSVCI